jgi:hypothetical protein
MKNRQVLIVLSLLLLFLSACKSERENEFSDDFNQVNDRIWIGKNYWAVPLENWQIKNGRIESDGALPKMRVNLLTQLLKSQGNLKISLDIGRLNKNKTEGMAGLSLGIKDKTDNDIRSLCYFGRGINAGVSTEGYIFVDTVRQALTKDFNYEKFHLSIDADQTEQNRHFKLTVTDDQANKAEIVSNDKFDLSGMIAIVNNHNKTSEPDKGASFWFDNLKVSGSIIEQQPENVFGPILWAMFTQSKGVLKMSAQFPPIGKDDSQTVELQIYENNSWKKIAESQIDTTAYLAVFKTDNWNADKEHKYRLLYKEKYKDKASKDFVYEGIIPADPVDRPMVMAGLTCQHHNGFPYRPLFENLSFQNPDLLYFSGDQIYERNGGYPIIRYPADKSILNYLGKWYMFGWAFGDLMRNRPTICIPDDHEVYQGNLWGNGGEKISEEEWNTNSDCIAGFVQPVEMINTVMKTNCSHLPDPHDPNSMKNNIKSYHTDLVYGGVSFAIVGDRLFKSGPDKVAWWDGRKDHIKDSNIQAEKLERPDLTFLGQSQKDFLEEWVTDWKAAKMKVVLSQTIFANVATHHGADKTFLVGDMDSGAWPKNGRDEALKIMRKAFAFHICGDQHLPIFGQYGIDEQRDAGWAFCTPAISVGYQRRFLPDLLSIEMNNPPTHNLPNTGEYQDFFGNYFYVYAVGNYAEKAFDKNRYRQAQKRTSGYGIIRFDTQERTIKADAVPFLADLKSSKGKHSFPGWPLEISQFDNYGKDATAFLPEIKVNNLSDPVLELYVHKSNELVYSIRIKGNSHRPKVFEKGLYYIKLGDPEKDVWKTIENISSESNTSEISVDF